jgi:hypothetical protein
VLDQPVSGLACFFVQDLPVFVLTFYLRRRPVGGSQLGPDRACKMRAWALYCGLRLFASLGACGVKPGTGLGFY